MNKFSILSLDRKKLSCLFIGYLCLMVTACARNDDSSEHSSPSHYRIFTKSNNTILYLAVVGIGIDNVKIQIIDGELPTTFNDTVAWGFVGESTFKVSSWNRWLGGKNLLALSEDTSNLAFSLVSSGLNTRAVKWQINSLPDGGCVIQNELLGSELALAVDTSTEPFTPAMMSIDIENETQRWQLEAYTGWQSAADASADIALAGRCR